MYSLFYKLKAKPFQLNPDPKFFFNSEGHSRALSYLRYGLEQGEGFIVVTGSPGTGKTMLVKALFNDLDSREVVAGQLVSTQINAEDTLRLISASFGLAHENIGKAALIKNLENFFQARAKEGRRVLLVVDEAQNLPLQSLEELRMLSNFEFNGKAIFQSFLLGQDEFRATINSPSMEQVRQRVTATFHLKPLESAESKAYILHRLKTAGWNKDPEFTTEAFKEIFRFTQGTPRKINTLCDRLMLFGFLEELHKIDKEAATTVTSEMQEDAAPVKSRQAVNNPAPERATVSPITTATAPVQVVAVDPVLTAAERLKNDDLERRVVQLETTVEVLKKTLKKERALLRKAILLHLELGDESEEDLLD